MNSEVTWKVESRLALVDIFVSLRKSWYEMNFPFGYELVKIFKKQK